jgi:hypothetical protein
VIVENISIRPRKIILTEMNNYMTNSDVPISALRQSIYHAHKKSLPSNPKSVSDVHKTSNYMNFTTSKNQDLLLINDKI